MPTPLARVVLQACGAATDAANRHTHAARTRVAKKGGEGERKREARTREHAGARLRAPSMREPAGWGGASGELAGSGVAPGLPEKDAVTRSRSVGGANNQSVLTGRRSVVGGLRLPWRIFTGQWCPSVWSGLQGQEERSCEESQSET